MVVGLTNNQEMDLVFAADSPWVWDAESNFRRLKEENPHLILAARRHNHSIKDTERGIKAAETHESHEEVEYQS